MKFIHIADCHLDGFREKKLSQLGFKSFKYSIDFALKENVDFVLLAGDLFNTALPRIDVLKDTVTLLKKLQTQSIPVYVIPGSHDYSPNGKTMLDVLENAGLLVNVFSGDITPAKKLMLTFTHDEKTNCDITGILGKRGMLDREHYENLDFQKLASNNFKIFMFHTSISELKPKELEMMESSALTLLPPNFDYYAGGHVHIRKRFDKDSYNNVVYPGPTFPNSFSELEKLENGSFIYYNDQGYYTDKKFDFVNIPTKKVISLNFDCEEKSTSTVDEMVTKKLHDSNLFDAIVLMRLRGTLQEGKPSELDYKQYMKICLDEGAFIVLKNTSKLSSKEFSDIEITEESTETLEANTIVEHIGEIPLPKNFNEKSIITELINILDQEQFDGEKKTAFNERMILNTKTILEGQLKEEEKDSD